MIGRNLLCTLILCVIASYAVASDLTITILYDNYSCNEALETGHGFSCLIEGTGKTVLFDTGNKGKILLGNMDKLGLSPKAIDIILLSHVKQDHIGGLSDVLAINSSVTVYTPEGFPERIRNKVTNAGTRCEELPNSVEICKAVHAIGKPTKKVKEKSLVIETEKGLVLITACAHVGIVKLVKSAKKLLGKDVYLIIGGLHLCATEPERIQKIAANLQKEGVKKVAPTHCSGDRTKELFLEAYGENFITVGVGKKVTIEDALPAK